MIPQSKMSLVEEFEEIITELCELEEKPLAERSSLERKKWNKLFKRKNEISRKLSLIEVYRKSKLRGLGFSSQFDLSLKKQDLEAHRSTYEFAQGIEYALRVIIKDLKENYEEKFDDFLGGSK